MDIAEFDFADDINSSWTLLTQTTEQQQQQYGHGSSLQQAGPTQEELRIQRIRDKNRRAQKRFREKAKEKDTALQQHVAQLEIDLQRKLEEKANLEAQYSELERRMQQPYCEAEIQAEKGGESLDPILMWNNPLSAEGGIPLAVACQRRLTHEEAMSLSVADHATINKAVCTKAKELLDANPERDPDTPAGRQLQALILEKHSLGAYLAGHNPLLMHRLQYLQKVASDQAIGPKFWQAACVAIRLRDEQKEYLLENRRRMLQATEKLVRERALLQQRLQELEVHPPSSNKANSMEAHMAWAQICQAIRENIDKEHIAICRFHALLWRAPFLVSPGLDPFQEAQLMVFCYPLMVNPLAMLESLLDKEQDAWPLQLDAEAETDSLEPAKVLLPDLATERYKPLTEKMLKLMIQARLSQKSRAAVE